MRPVIDTIDNAVVGAVVGAAVGAMGGPLWASFAAGAVVYMVHTAADRIVATIRSAQP